MRRLIIGLRPWDASVRFDVRKGNQMIVIRILAWSTVSTLLVALAEYFSHRFLMHRPLLNKFGHPGIFHEHAISHHHEGRTDVGVDMSIPRHLMYGSPFIVAAALFDLLGALILTSVLISYAIAWTKLHRAIHDIEDNWTRSLWFYAAMMRHHNEHHRRPGRNFGFVFPFTDYLFGTASPQRGSSSGIRGASYWTDS